MVTHLNVLKRRIFHCCRLFSAPTLSASSIPSSFSLFLPYPKCVAVAVSPDIAIRPDKFAITSGHLSLKSKFTPFKAFKAHFSCKIKCTAINSFYDYILHFFVSYFHILCCGIHFSLFSTYIIKTRQIESFS